MHIFRNLSANSLDHNQGAPSYMLRPDQFNAKQIQIVVNVEDTTLILLIEILNNTNIFYLVPF